ncbi:UNVERIFIED_CONTAM: hypothetical protein H355_011970 [Colinus virginianus]|nr:hypothetical protein H355_011970 [Colinus virginianus]
MGLASLYGALVLLVQSGNAWFCLLSTAALGAALGLGMAFSAKVRASVLLTLPHVFTTLNQALERLRREFEFNISVSHHFDVALNSSKTLGDVAADIMEAVGRRLQPTRQLLGLSAYISSCAILYMYLQ